ncbi:MAG: C4-dicarboxylate ABC transporter [Firmicutes bacterium]|nr:C4-dicarboxylate ABC transporter [Bacillota bacterium]MCL5066633.1 C4-dicarboxylate ABC transporter [Bacillota bacterium]
MKSFTPNWFTVAMGTGIVALDAFLLPGAPIWLKHVGTGFWIGNMALVLLFTLLLLYRAITDWRGFRDIFHHPQQSMFFGAIPMALTTVVNGFIDMGPALIGTDAYHLAGVLWIINAVIALASALVVPYFMFTRHQHELNTMTAIWLMPIVPAEVAAASGALLLPHLAAAGLQQTLFIVSTSLWAMSVPLAVLLLGVLFLRFAVHNLPPADMAISTWISLGTLGTGIMGLVLLGNDSQLVFPALATGLKGSAMLLALVLWGFGIWWFLQSIALTIHYAYRLSLPFNLGWWGLTFPLGVFAAGTDLLLKAFQMVLLKDAALVFFGLLVAFWLVVASRTLWLLISPQISRTVSKAPVKPSIPEAS